MLINRRALMGSASGLVLTGILSRPLAAQGFATSSLRVRATAAPLASVRLKPSIYADAKAANRNYLASLDPERLLHNFYLSAGLAAPKPIYGGWEALGIAGHSMGHWLSGVSLIIANGGDAELGVKLDYALAEMARIQAAHGDGYCGGTTVERDGKIVDGKAIFEEVRRGDIRSQGFDLNGGWVPLYTWHKVHAGLIDAYRLAGRSNAMPILKGVAGYLAGVVEPLDTDQMQRLLRTEHGGLNESYADTFAITGDQRWLEIARKFYHAAVLDPLVAQRDELEGLHANTQIPKVIGLARIHEVAGAPNLAGAAEFFHRTVTDHHTYVIGGNSEREHFGPPDQRAERLGEATCEACNSYNMLKLTRHLYGWNPDARFFDFYERTQLNHIMAHQRPSDGRFVYFMPLASGARRIFSEPEDSFWCCVGSGMESHSKHADSIYWSDGTTLFVNLYIPSEMVWPDSGFAVELNTSMPQKGEVRLLVKDAPKVRRAIAMRIPDWSGTPTVTLNGGQISPIFRDGYAVVEKLWQPGDTITLDLPMTLRTERVPDDPSTVAFLHGPLVLSADMGAADEELVAAPPVLVSETEVSASILRSEEGDAHFTTHGGLGETLKFSPFFDRYDRRSAVYFPTFTVAEWASQRDGYLAELHKARALLRRTIDTLFLGEMQPERDHDFVPGKSEVVNWNGRAARRLPPNETMRFTLERRPGEALLRTLVWNADASTRFTLSVDGAIISKQWPVAGRQNRAGFVALDFPLPALGTQGRDAVTVDITAGPVQALIYEVRMLIPSEANHG